MKLTYLGHSAWRIDGSRTIFIDPFLSQNPRSTTDPATIDRADYVLVTHEHRDHIGDAFEICRRTGAVLVSLHELSVKATDEGLRSIGANIGGLIKLDGLDLYFTQAFHSGISNPSGIVLVMDGKRIYHAGDTGLFGDMALIGAIHGPLDVALVPIGGHFTMDEVSAAKAVELLKPKIAVPMHYDTWPLIEASPDKFKALVGNHSTVMIQAIGSAMEV